jgi:hypothetical protein
MRTNALTPIVGVNTYINRHIPFSYNSADDQVLAIGVGGVAGQALA